VDDVLTWAHTKEELIRNQNELIQLMKCAGMELGKWVSNLSRVADRSLATTEVQGTGSNSTAKVLGILQSLPHKKSAQHQTPSAVRCGTSF